MAGTPVWLASLSRPKHFRDGRVPMKAARRAPGFHGIPRLATSLWSPMTIETSADILRRLLGDAGDASRERLFRMQVTLCLHRAVREDELARLPEYFHADPALDIAGGPVEILEETEPGAASTKPCHDPRRVPLDPYDRLLWVPEDCGRCEPCLARLAIMEGRTCSLPPS